MSNTDYSIFVKGDTIELPFQLFKDKAKNEYWNLLNHQIRFQLNTPSKIYKATANVTGGGDNQILLVDAATGSFLITVTFTESAEIIKGEYSFEIQVSTPDPDSKKYTVLQSHLRIVEESINWDDRP